MQATPNIIAIDEHVRGTVARAFVVACMSCPFSDDPVPKQLQETAPNPARHAMRAENLFI
jgi:hypothetical protein